MLTVSQTWSDFLRKITTSHPQRRGTKRERALGIERVEDRIALAADITVTTGQNAFEGGQNGNFTFQRTGDTTGALTVSYSVSGTATSGSDYQALSGSVTFGAGQTSVDVSVVAIDDSVPEANETVTVSLTGGGGGCCCGSGGYTIGTPSSATIDIIDNDTQQQPSVWVSSTTDTAEGGSPGAIVLSRSGTTASALTVTYTVSGTATNGTDYQNLSGTATFNAGQATTSIAVSAIEDSLVEGNETVILNLTAGGGCCCGSGGYTLGSPSSGTVNIADNDTQTQPTVSVTSIIDSTEGGMVGGFLVSRTGSTDAALTVAYTIGGTATNGVDYTALSGTATIAAGQASATISVAAGNDSLVEGTETVILTLAAGAYNIGIPASATVNILDSTPLPTVNIASTMDTSEGGTPGGFILSRTGPTAAALTVAYTVGGTATSGDDYTALSGTVTFAAGQSSASITVTALADGKQEGNETVVATLSKSTAYNLGAQPAGTVNISDQQAPTITITAIDPNATEGATAATTDNGAFRISRSDNRGALTVCYSVLAGMNAATPNVDYTALVGTTAGNPNSGTVTFQDGVSDVELTVTPIDDNLPENDETVTVQIVFPCGPTQYTAGNPSSATVTIHDNDMNRPPVAEDDSYTIAAGQDQFQTSTIAGDKSGLLANDKDPNPGDTISFSAVTTQPQFGTVSVNGGVLTYVEGANWNGYDSFKYTIVDSAGATATATVRIGSSQPGYSKWRYGNPDDSQVSDNTGGLLLEGGQDDVDGAFTWMLQHADGSSSKGGDIVILRATGGADYNGYIPTIAQQAGLPVNSVTTLAFDFSHLADAKDAANSQDVINILNGAEAVFIAGGDQNKYIQLWSGTAVEQIIEQKFAAGKLVLGGTSAGLAVQGAVDFSAENIPGDDDALMSSEALANPFDSEVTFSTEFLNTTPLANTITETHFMPGDLDPDGRMGRLLTFMARMTIGYSNVTRGLALSGNTALLYDSSSQSAQVVGRGSAYFISAPTQGTMVLQAGIPLTYTGAKVHRVSASSGAFMWSNAWSLDGTFGSEYGVSVNNGVVTSTTGSIY